ncbi:hypothetical protein VW23_005030 [Devosia insulae DS-56]|uniref:Uncharacterized protein n=1 Tax=Devosia insulae DS-56 TaxID=1116389 RepID=A0A1E5XIE1_9HYPH|nr:hypothetical protein [Devosia insulae]OEO28366.1 hypothetical protein VW23_005030 [Devosia insulae DS-56]
MTEQPSPFLTRPPMPGAEAQAAFDALFDDAVAAGPNTLIDYDLPWPRWQFISHIVDTRQLISHGSPDGAIEQFEPRQSHDAHPFGNRQAVYGASDGLWSMYYAILDRATHPMLLVNSAARVELDDGSLGDPFYFFSISQPALDARAFRAGTLYLLPRDSFEQMPPLMVGGQRAHVPQWASLKAVTPLARIAVAPEDFPFLEQIRGHDDALILERAKSDPDGFPWLD